MAFKCQVLFAMLLLLTLCSQSLSGEQGVRSFKNTIVFTRRIRLRVQALLLQYNKQQLGDRRFDDQNLKLHTLPTIDSEYSHWVAMQDCERLSQASQHLHTFWVHLNTKRRQLEVEHHRQRAGQYGLHHSQSMSSIDKAMLEVQMDLRDLIQHVNAQLHWLNSTAVSSPTPRSIIDSTLSDAPGETSSTSPLLPRQHLWSSRLEGYVILRDLGRYLGKLVREFTLLEHKYHA